MCVYVCASERAWIVCQAQLPPLSGSDAKGPVVSRSHRVGQSFSLLSTEAEICCGQSHNAILTSVADNKQLHSSCFTTSALLALHPQRWIGGSGWQYQNFVTGSGEKAVMK